MGRAEFQIENERLLEKAREAGVEIRSFEGWKSVGKWVRKGMKTKTIQVRAGSVRRVNTTTGEDEYDPRFRTAYGFTADQVS